ncbi:MAG: alpha/beta hydrolase [Chloroflexi bacterium]|nr:alpha/beta hydrolase [Chloroflexota bacterium]
MPHATAHNTPVGLRSPLHFEIRGSGPDLVMLHGGAGGIADLAELRERLGTGRRVISPDQRGHGRSSGEGEISYAAQAVDTAALLDELNVRNADVLGWSDGGIVGLLLTRDRPDLVGRLIAISANAALSSRHGPDLRLEDLGRISASVLYLAADADIVPLEHTVAMVRATPGAHLAIVPDADHHLVLKRVDEVAAIVERFLTG